MLVVLYGQGVAVLGSPQIDVKPGSVLPPRPGHTHAVRSLGVTHLYCLTTMVPDEDFARLITSGVRDTLDEEDLTILGRN